MVFSVFVTGFSVFVVSFVDYNAIFIVGVVDVIIFVDFIVFVLISCVAEFVFNVIVNKSGFNKSP